MRAPSDSAWLAYLRDVYGDSHPALELDPKDVDVIYVSLARRHNLSLDELYGVKIDNCADTGIRDGSRFAHVHAHWEAPFTEYVYHVHERPAASSHTWIEITHCSERARRKHECGSRPSLCLEQQSLFMYPRPGSGVWYNSGHTVVFHTHAAAFHSCGLSYEEPVASPPAIANATLAQSLRAEYAARYYSQQRSYALLHNRLSSCLRRRGYSSVQFMQAPDSWCGKPMLEIVDLTTSGLGCLGDLTLRTGWRGTGPPVKRCSSGCAVPPAVCDAASARCQSPGNFTLRAVLTWTRQLDAYEVAPLSEYTVP